MDLVSRRSGESLLEVTTESLSVSTSWLTTLLSLRADGDNGDGRYRPGEVVHTMGFPLDSHTYGGGWAYHMDGGLVSLGLVVGADWSNPYRQPYRDMQVLSFSLPPTISRCRLTHAFSRRNRK